MSILIFAPAALMAAIIERPWRRRLYRVRKEHFT